LIFITYVVVVVVVIVIYCCYIVNCYVVLHCCCLLMPFVLLLLFDDVVTIILFLHLWCTHLIVLTFIRSVPHVAVNTRVCRFAFAHLHCAHRLRSRLPHVEHAFHVAPRDGCITFPLRYRVYSFVMPLFRCVRYVYTLFGVVALRLRCLVHVVYGALLLRCVDFVCCCVALHYYSYPYVAVPRLRLYTTRLLPLYRSRLDCAFTHFALDARAARMPHAVTRWFPTRVTPHVYFDFATRLPLILVTFTYVVPVDFVIVTVCYIDFTFTRAVCYVWLRCYTRIRYVGYTCCTFYCYSRCGFCVGRFVHRVWLRYARYHVYGWFYALFCVSPTPLRSGDCRCLDLRYVDLRLPVATFVTYIRTYVCVCSRHVVHALFVCVRFVPALPEFTRVCAAFTRCCYRCRSFTFPRCRVPFPLRCTVYTLLPDLRCVTTRCTRSCVLATTLSVLWVCRSHCHFAALRHALPRFTYGLPVTGLHTLRLPLPPFRALPVTPRVPPRLYCRFCHAVTAQFCCSSHGFFAFTTPVTHAVGSATSAVWIFYVPVVRFLPLPAHCGYGFALRFYTDTLVLILPHTRFDYLDYAFTFTAWCALPFCTCLPTPLRSHLPHITPRFATRLPFAFAFPVLPFGYVGSPHLLPAIDFVYVCRLFRHAAVYVAVPCPSSLLRSLLCRLVALRLRLPLRWLPLYVYAVTVVAVTFARSAAAGTRSRLRNVAFIWFWYVCCRFWFYVCVTLRLLHCCTFAHSPLLHMPFHWVLLRFRFRYHYARLDLHSRTHVPCRSRVTGLRTARLQLRCCHLCYVAVYALRLPRVSRLLQIARSVCRYLPVWCVHPRYVLILPRSLFTFRVLLPGYAFTHVFRTLDLPHRLILLHRWILRFWSVMDCPVTACVYAHTHRVWLRCARSVYTPAVRLLFTHICVAVCLFWFTSVLAFCVHTCVFRLRTHPDLPPHLRVTRLPFTLPRYLPVATCRCFVYALPPRRVYAPRIWITRLLDYARFACVYVSAFVTTPRCLRVRSVVRVVAFAKHFTDLFTALFVHPFTCPSRLLPF